MVARSKFRTLLLKHHLPLLLVLAITLGLLVPLSADPAFDRAVISSSLVVMFLVAGAKLRTDEMRSAVANKCTLAFGAASILLISPLFATVLVAAAPKLSAAIPPSFLLGLAVFSLQPTTSSSCIILTGEAGGNVAIAVLLCAATNLAATLLLPLSTILVLGSDAVELDPLPLLAKLVGYVLVPLAVAKAIITLSERARGVATRHRQALTLCSSVALCAVPWVKVGNSSATIVSTIAADPGVVLLLVLAAALVHGVFLVFNTFATSSLGLGLGPEARKAIVLTCSLKNLALAIVAIDAIAPQQGRVDAHDGHQDNNATQRLTPRVVDKTGLDGGMMVLACVLGHLIQVLIDSVIVSVWRGRELGPHDEQASEQAAKNTTKKFKSSVDKKEGKEMTVVVAAARDEKPGERRRGERRSVDEE